MAWAPGQAGGKDADFSSGKDDDEDEDDDATVPQPRLCVVGTDRRAVEIDVGASSLAVGLKHRPERPRLEQSAIPTACAWVRADGRADVRGTMTVDESLPESGKGGELQLLVASDAHKIRMWGASPLSSRSCRRTLRAPLFGGPPSFLVPVPGLEGMPMGGLRGGE